jgi:ABC-type protease/lipase transport system fused ATPase/permease subunit
MWRDILPFRKICVSLQCVSCRQHNAPQRSEEQLTIHCLYMIEMYGATVASGEREIATGISFMADGGKRVAIAGGNDSDKQTVLEALHGLVPLKAGWVCIDSEPLVAQTIHHFRSQMSYMPLAMGAEDITVEQLVQQLLSLDSNADCIYSKKALLSEWKALRIDAACYDMTFGDIDAATTQRIMLSIVGLFARPIALLHTPTSQQDADGQAAVKDYLSSPRFKETAVIIATDDAQLLNVCDTVIRLNP